MPDTSVLTPQALAATDWADRVLALLPESLIPTDEQFEEDESASPG